MKKHLFDFIFVLLLASCTSPDISHTSPLPPSRTPPSFFFPSQAVTIAPSRTPFPTPYPYPFIVNSPDGKLSAKLHINPTDIYDKPVIEVWDQEGSVIWKVPYQWDWDPLVAPSADLTIYGWSPDSSKLYFYYSFSYDIGGPTLAFVRDLQSLNIHTGDINRVIPGPAGCPTAFGFSPDMDKLAYISTDRVGILDLATGSDKNVQILTEGFDDAGWIYYSPSGNRIIYHTVIYAQEAFAILLDPRTMKQEIVWQDYFIMASTFDGWTTDENPRYLDYEDNVFIIDLNAHARTEIGTATPEP